MSKKEEKKASESINNLDQNIKKLEIQKSLLIDDYLSSDDPDKIIKAATYIQEQEKSKKGTGVKAHIFSPEDEFYNGLGYKDTVKSVTYDLLRKMGKTPHVFAVKSTRMEQVEDFTVFTLDDQKEGWTIRRKLSRFERYKGKHETNSKEERRIEEIADFVENCGKNNKWETQYTFNDWVKMTLNDAFDFDQVNTEFVRTVGTKELIQYQAIDASTIRLMETIDPRHKDQFNFKEINGFKPIYCQVWQNRIATNPITKQPIVYYPWDMTFYSRNKTTDIRANGYGISELEILIEIITWLLWGMQYNGNFFKQGSNPKGFFTIEGAADQNMLNEFRQAWRQTMTGVVNSHKVPIFEGQKVTWQDMQVSNKDMEFQNWNEFLTILTCAVFRMDPSELGFNFKTGSQLFGQDGQKERLKHSKTKGLKPLLKMLQRLVNKYIVSEIDDNYEFTFTGIDLEDEEQKIKNIDAALSAGITSFEKQFEAFEGEPYDEKKHTILNQVFQQAQQAKLYGGEESNEAVNQMTGEEGEVSNPFEEYTKADPIWNQVNKYMEQTFRT